MTVKLIASDMDDTLLNSNTKLSERNAAAIHKAIDEGIVFLIATGRMYVSVKPYADALGLDVPLVTYNGALVKGSKSGKVYYEHPLKLETALELLAYCKEKGYYIQSYQGDELWVKEETVFSAESLQITGHDKAGRVPGSVAGYPAEVCRQSDCDQFPGQFPGTDGTRRE